MTNPTLATSPLWAPSDERLARANLTAYMKWLSNRGQPFDTYQSLWEWSVTDLRGFWGSLWKYFEIRAAGLHERVLLSETMPGAQWFPDSLLNYAEQVFRHERPDVEAMLYAREGHALRSVSWNALGDQVRRLATWMRGRGLTAGDRVVAYLPNGPEAVIAMLASVSVGAIWASCGPDLGAPGVIDRFAQLTPRMLFCVDGYYYGGKPFDRRLDIEKIINAIPTLEETVYLQHLGDEPVWSPPNKTVTWDAAVAGPSIEPADFVYARVAFAHPIWILFSSGTTGLPKPIVHSHGGMILEQMKSLTFHMDLHPRERIFFYTTTGWMMWNFLVSSLLVDAVPVLYDGNPAYPGPDLLWRLVEQSRTSFFGASPTYIGILEKQGFRPREHHDLSALQTVMLAGSPVTAECMSWVYDNVKSDVFAHSGSGGTDVCTGLVGGVVTLPVYGGEIQARQLGVAAYAYDQVARSHINEVGELVVTAPMPSMPVGLWNDKDGQRLHESYFDRFPGVWRHGDFFKINERGGCFVLGRSDATLNRHGVRIGTAEVYRSLANVRGIEDAVIVNLDLTGGHFFMPLFVKLAKGVTLDSTLKDIINRQMRSDYSPRHVPDKIIQVRAIPYTLSGKKMEVPVRRILMGVALEKVANTAGMSDPRAFDDFLDYARTQRDYRNEP